MLSLVIALSSGANADGVTAKIVLGKSGLTPGARIEGATYTPTAAVSAHATNYKDFNLKADGTSIATWNSKTGETGAHVAGTPIPLTVTSTKLDAGDVLSVEITDQGTGPATSGFLTVFYRPEGT